MSDTPLPPPPTGGDHPPTAVPAAPPTAGPATEPPTVAGPTAVPAPRWKPVAAIAGSALGGALIAFLISWAVIGHDSTSNRLPISSSDGRAAQSQDPSTGSGTGSASGSTGRGPGQSQGQSQGQSSSGSASGSTGQSQGSMPSARSGAS